MSALKSSQRSLIRFQSLGMILHDFQIHLWGSSFYPLSHQSFYMSEHVFSWVVALSCFLPAESWDFDNLLFYFSCFNPSLQCFCWNHFFKDSEDLAWIFSAFSLIGSCWNAWKSNTLKFPRDLWFDWGGLWGSNKGPWVWVNILTFWSFRNFLAKGCTITRSTFCMPQVQLTFLTFTNFLAIQRGWEFLK